MDRTKLGIVALVVWVGLLPGSLFAVTRDIADLEPPPLTLRQSVIGQLSGGVLQDPYDEFLQRPFNLSFVNMERHTNLSPWPGQAGEQQQYLDFLVGNNGASNVSNGADTLQGTYIGQSMDKLAWGVSAALLTDQLQSSDAVAGSSFGDSAELSGLDARFGLGYRVTNRIVLGGGVSLFDTTDDFQDSSFTQGIGGFFGQQALTSNGAEFDIGMRWFSGEARSWEGKLQTGVGRTELNDFSEILDAAGAVTSRFVVTRYDISDSYLQLSGGFNQRLLNEQGEMQFQLGFRRSEHTLDNSDLSFTDDGVSVTTNLLLMGQQPVTDDELFASAGTLFMRGWTQIFSAARVSLAQTSGSTQVDSLGTIVNESVDDSYSRLSLIMGLKQPLWNERFRLVARGRADWLDQSRATIFNGAASGTDSAQTTTSFAIGVETVLNNMVFDVAWLSGDEPLLGSSSSAGRQTIDLDRLVISATFGW